MATVGTRFRIPNPTTSTSTGYGFTFMINESGGVTVVEKYANNPFYVGPDGNGNNKYIIDFTAPKYNPITYEGINYNITEVGNGSNSLILGFSAPNVSVIFSSTIKKINAGAFNYSTNFANDIVLPPSLEYIGSAAFMNFKMKSINIPPKVSTIDYNAFYNTGLSSITFEGNLLPRLKFINGRSPFYTLYNCKAYFINTSICPTTSYWNELIVVCGQVSTSAVVNTTQAQSLGVNTTQAQSLGVNTAQAQAVGINTTQAQAVGINTTQIALEKPYQEIINQDLVKLNDTTVQIPVSKILDVDSNLDSAISKIVDTIASNNSYQVGTASGDILPVYINPINQSFNNTKSENFYQNINPNIKYVAFIFNTNNLTTQSQINALGNIDFLNLGKQDNTNNTLIYLVIIIIVAILAAIGFFIYIK